MRALPDRRRADPRLGAGALLGQVVDPEHHVLRRDGHGAPLDGERMLFDDSMSTCASICASMESGTCTAIWSPSKSALNAVQTSG